MYLHHSKDCADNRPGLGKSTTLKWLLLEEALGFGDRKNLGDSSRISQSKALFTLITIDSCRSNEKLVKLENISSIE